MSLVVSNSPNEASHKSFIDHFSGLLVFLNKKEKSF